MSAGEVAIESLPARELDIVAKSDGMLTPGVVRRAVTMSIVVVSVCLVMAGYELFVFAMLCQSLSLPCPLLTGAVELLKATSPWLVGAPLIAFLGVRFRIHASHWLAVSCAQLLACSALVAFNLLADMWLEPLSPQDVIALEMPESLHAPNCPLGQDGDGAAAKRVTPMAQPGPDASPPQPSPGGPLEPRRANSLDGDRAVDGLGPPPQLAPPLGFRVLSIVFVYLSLALVVQGLLAFGELRRRDRFEAELRAQAANSQLAALRLQMRPHFLFNALNSVSATMTTDIDQARRMLSDLSALLRGSFLDVEEQEVPLSRELDFTMRYAEIQKVRFGSRMSVLIEADEDAQNACVPWLSLQPLVENFVMHAVEKCSRTCHLSISARRDDDLLRIDVVDDGPGPDLQVVSGVGLANTQARFRQLYGERGKVTATALPGSGFRVRLSLPFNTRCRSEPRRV